MGQRLYRRTQYPGIGRAETVDLGARRDPERVGVARDRAHVRQRHCIECAVRRSIPDQLVVIGENDPVAVGGKRSNGTKPRDDGLHDDDGVLVDWQRSVVDRIDAPRLGRHESPGPDQSNIEQIRTELHGNHARARYRWSSPRRAHARCFHQVETPPRGTSYYGSVCGNGVTGDPVERGDLSTVVVPGDDLLSIALEDVARVVHDGHALGPNGEGCRIHVFDPAAFVASSESNRSIVRRCNVEGAISWRSLEHETPRDQGFVDALRWNGGANDRDHVPVRAPEPNLAFRENGKARVRVERQREAADGVGRRRILDVDERNRSSIAESDQGALQGDQAIGVELARKRRRGARGRCVVQATVGVGPKEMTAMRRARTDRFLDQRTSDTVDDFEQSLIRDGPVALSHAPDLGHDARHLDRCPRSNRQPLKRMKQKLAKRPREHVALTDGEGFDELAKSLIRQLGVPVLGI